jgi:PKD repeat protein
MVPVLPAAAIRAEPVAATLTTPATPLPQPVAAETFRAGAAVKKLLPAASFTVTPSAGSAPLSVTCDASASTPGPGTLQSFAWNFGDGTTGSGTPVTHVYTRTGTYTVTLVVADSYGRTASAFRQVGVSPPVTARAVHIASERPPIHLL